MEHETRVTYGSVPDRLRDDALLEMAWQMEDDEFLLRATGELYFHYQRGSGIKIHRGRRAAASDESLWLNGSVYAAIASMNSLLPIHASAVALGRSVYAFTGPAGSGKSTLTAALGQIGMPMFCDDTLVLDLSDPQQIMCLPGHKRLKLTQDAVELTGAIADEQVGTSVKKFYCTPPSGEVGIALPLAQLIFLDDGPGPIIDTLSGLERFERMQSDHYTAELHASARRFDRSSFFAHLTTLANRVPSVRFVRPRDISRFDAGVATIADYLNQEHARPTNAALTKLRDRFNETANGDEIIIVQLDRGDFLSLTGIAAMVWRLIDGKRSRTDLITTLANEFALENEVIAGDVDDFLKQLRQSGLLADG
jgi:hypothetical protein